MSIIRYRTPQLAEFAPLSRLSSLRDLLDSRFEFATVRSAPFGGWSPALDVFEDDAQVTVRLELAGVTRDAFDVQLNDKVLTISGERKADTEKSNGESFRSERFFGSFSRSIELPSPVKAGEVTAAYTDGVLTVTLPKSEEARPRKIEVTLN